MDILVDDIDRYEQLMFQDSLHWFFANVSLAVAMLLMLSSVIMSHFMKKYKYPYPQPNFHTVDP